MADMADIHLVPKEQIPDLSLLIERYKTTRLTALQLDPGAFGSTYAREIQFTDDIWQSRLLNPLSKTFVSIDTSNPRLPPTGRIDLARQEWLGTATIFGPKPLSDSENSSVWTTYTRDNFNEPPDLSVVKGSHAIYMIVGVFVHPSHRRKGCARRLIQAAVRAATEEAKQAGASKVTVVLETEPENQAAGPLYESAGFLAVEREGSAKRGMMLEVELSSI